MSRRRDYEAYMSDLWDVHGPRVRTYSGWRHHPFEDRFGYELSRLARVWRVVRSVDGADVGLAVGAFLFPVSPETQSWGALVSVTAGVGTVMNGVGDLRGE